MERMTKPLAKIWARRIHDGAKTIEEVEERYGEGGVDMVRAAYFELFGQDITA